MKSSITGMIITLPKADSNGSCANRHLHGRKKIHGWFARLGLYPIFSLLCHYCALAPNAPYKSVLFTHGLIWLYFSIDISCCLIGKRDKKNKKYFFSKKLYSKCDIILFIKILETQR
jgi:hypothetical protein